MNGRALASIGVLVAGLTGSVGASAFADGEAPNRIVDLSVFGGAASAGNTLMQFDGNTNANFALLPLGSTANVNGLDPDATVVQAILFWAGSQDLIFGADRDVDFRLPSGTNFNDLSVDSPVPGETLSALNRCNTRTFGGTQFFSCRRDVTFLLQQLGAGGADGSYQVSDVDARPGNCATDPGTCQAMFAGWSLVVVWQSPLHPVRRDIVLYDAFYGVDEQNPQGGAFSTGLSPTFVLDGFTVGPDEEVSLTFMGFEGDAQLGTPPQDNMAIGGGLFCPTCADFIEVSGGGGTVRLTDAVNPAGNLFNGSNNQGGGSHPGLDIDSFDIGATGLGVLNTGNTSMTMRVGSGDGVPGNGTPGFNPGVTFDTSGSGEFVMLSFVLLSNDTFAPRLDAGDTQKIVLQSEAGPGDTLNYTLRVENTGSALATAVRIRDVLPAGVTYQSASTTNTCGVSSADVGGVSPVLSAGGLVIGNLAVGVECEVRFRVTVNAATAPGTVLQNFFTVEAANAPQSTIGPASTTIIGPSIETPQKTVSVVGGGLPVPGAQLIYTVRIENDGTVTANDMFVSETIPVDTDTLQIVSFPPGATNLSNTATGTVQITNIDIPVGQDREVVYIVRIRPTTTPGTVILNQADVGAAWFPGGFTVTDDPTLPGGADPTVITVVSGVTITTSTKTGTDVNGGVLAPGDVVEYRITVRQTGPVPITVVVDDSLSALLNGCTIVSVPLGGFAACNAGGANGTGRVDATIPVLAGGQADVVFRATVNTTTDGAIVTNQARLTPLQDPTAEVIVTANPFTVFARPLLSTSTKSVVDLNGGQVRPGDVLRYTINAVNTGTVAAQNAVVTDPVDANVDVELPLANGGVLAGGVITWNLGTLALGAPVTRVFDVRVRALTPDGTVVTNTATVSADAPAQPFTTPPVNVTVRAAPTLVVTKTVLDVGPPPFEPADVVRYTVRIENTGDGVATNVVVRDPLDAAFVQPFFPSGGRLEGTDVVFDVAEHAPLGSLAPGAFTTVTFDAELRTPLANGRVVTNQASVSGANVSPPVLSDDPSTAVVGDSTNFTITSTSTLALTKTFVDQNAGDLMPGDTVTFALTVTAGGNAPATAVEIRDPLDPRLTFVSSTTGGTLVGSEVRFTAATNPALSSVDPGNSVVVTFVATIAAPLANGTLIPNQASASAPVAAAVSSDDPTTPAPLDPTVLAIVSRPVLDTFAKSVVELDGDGVFSPGDRIRYTIRVENTGTENATNIVVTDVVPANLTDLLVLDGGTLVGTTATWNNALPALGALGPGAFVDVRVEATIVRPLGDLVVISNQASLVADGIPATLSDDTTSAAIDDPTNFTVRSFPMLVVEKRVSDGNGLPVEPGDALNYEIRIRNIGDRPATQITVTDPVATTLTGVVVGQGGAFAASTAMWTQATTPALASLAIDTETVLTFTANVVSPLGNGTFIDNQATVSLGEPGIPGAPFVSDDPFTAAPLDPTRVQVVSASNLSVSVLESTDGGGAAIDTARPGNTIRYVLLVRNSGNAVADNVVVTLPVPTTLQFVSAEGGALVGGNVVFNAGTSPLLSAVGPGAEVALAFTATVVNPLDNGTIIDVQGAITATGVVSPFVTDDPSTAVLGDVTRLTIVSEAILSLSTKTFVDVNGAPVEPGDVVQYVMSISNVGDAVARNVVVSDPLPVGVTFVNSSTNGVFAGGVVTHSAATNATLVALAPGGPPVELRIEVQVNAAVATGTVISNQATVAADATPAIVTDDPLTAAVDDPTSFTVVTVPNVAFTKDLLSATGRVLAPGDPITYVFTLTSTGTAALGAATVNDVLPLSLVDVVPGPGVNFNAGTNALSINVPAMPLNTSLVFTVAARVSDAAINGTVIQNQATYAEPTVGVRLSDDPITAVDDDPTVAIVEAFPVLTTSTKVGTDLNGGALMPGDSVRYVIRINNSGNGQARDVTVSDLVDTASLEVITIENNGQQSGSLLTWTDAQTQALDNIAAGAFVEVAFTARVRNTVVDGTIIDNQGQIGARDVPDLVPTDDPSTAVVDDATRFVVAAPVISFTKSFTDGTGGSPLRPGDDVIYDIVVTNQGSVAANNVVITDVVPEFLIDVVAEGGSVVGGVATWTSAVVGANSSHTVRLRGSVDPLAQDGDLLINQAELVFDQGTPRQSDDPSTPAPNDATVRTIDAEEAYTGTVVLLDEVSGAPISGPVVPGQRVRVRVNMVASGTEAGQAVVVTIPQNPIFFRLDASLDGGVENPDGTAFRWTASTRPDLAAVLPGESRLFEAVGEIRSPIPDGVVVDVRAIVTSALSAAEEWTLGPATMTVVSRPNLSRSTKEIVDENGGVVEPGDVLTYRITVKNDGGAEASGLVVVDPPPAGTVFLPGSLAVAGAPVPDGGGLILANGLSLGELGAGRSLVVAFKVRVDVKTLRGFSIVNQAVLKANGIGDTVTDDPRTPLIEGDPTIVVVGGGPRLVVGKSANRASVSPGEPVTFSIVIDNVGSDVAHDVHLVDELVAPGRYRTGSIVVNGTAMTDVDDGDAAVFADGGNPRVEVRRAALEPSESMTVTFVVDVDAGTALFNQASVTGDGVVTVLSDAVPSAPGAQPLIVPITGGARTILVDTGTTVLLDQNGGTVAANDPLLARTVVSNRSAETIALTNLAFELSALLALDDTVPLDPRFTFDPATRTVSLAPGANITIAESQGFTVDVPVRIIDGANDGEVVRVAATGVVATLDAAVTRNVDFGASTLTLGLIAGTSALSGTLFVDDTERNGTFDAASDARARGFQVMAFANGQSDGAPSRTAVSDQNGRYRLLPLPAGSWRIVVKSEGGATYRVVDDVVVVAGEVKDLDIRIDPSGVVYRAATFASIRGARAYLYTDDGDADPTNDVLVPDDDLLAGQQGQVTTGQGFYRFDPRPGTYRLVVEPSSALFAFPSTSIPFEGRGGPDPFGVVATPAEDGRIVTHAVPAEGRSTKHFLRFNLAADRPPVLNNHIPLDGMQDAVRITKTASRRRVSVGDIVGYTVRVDNPSNGTVLERDGGVEIVDTLPDGFRLVPGSYRLVEIRRDARGQEQRRVVFVPDEREGRNLRFASFALLPDVSWELTYQVVVGPGTQFGSAENRARLLMTRGRVPITPDAIARVRVVPDPIFDLGTLRAKVFCDDNGDLWQDPGEMPMAGVRVYLDNGHYAESDVSGKLHFTGLLPGMHLAKLDERTLAPGVVVRTDVRASFYTSSGLPAQASFPLQCAFDRVTAPKITLNRDAYKVDTPPIPTRVVALDGDTPNRTVRFDGVEVPLLTADLGVAAEGQEPTFGSADGPNIAVDDDGVPRARVVFVPRGDSGAAITGWSLTIEKQTVIRAPLSSSPTSPSSPVAGGFIIVRTGADGGVTVADDAGVDDGGARIDGGAPNLDDAGVLTTRSDAGVLTDGGALAHNGTATSSPRVDAANSDGVSSLGERVETVAVYRFAGIGTPPPVLFWDGRDSESGALVVEKGVRYAAILAIANELGDEAASAARPFGFAFTDDSAAAASSVDGTPVPTTATSSSSPSSSPTSVGRAISTPTEPARAGDRARGPTSATNLPVSAVAQDASLPDDGALLLIDSTGGVLFSLQGKPSPRLESWLDENKDTWLAATGVVEITTHVDLSGDEATMALTSASAQAVKAALVARGVVDENIVARGEGDRLPRVPNLRDRDRLKNRRVEIRVLDESPLAPVKALSWPAKIVVDGTPVTSSAVGLFTVEASRPIGSVVTVEVTGAGLGRRVARRVIQAEGTGPATSSSVTAGAPVSLDLDVARGDVRYGGRVRSLAMLGIQLVPETQTASGGLFVMENGRGEIAFAPVVPAGDAPSRWTFRVLDDASPASALLTGSAVDLDAGPTASESSGSDAGISNGSVDDGAANSVDDAGGHIDDAGSGVDNAAPSTPTRGAQAAKSAPSSSSSSSDEERPARVLYELTGFGAPPARLVWDGTTTAGMFVAEPRASYHTRFFVENEQGDVGIAPDVNFVVGTNDMALTAKSEALILEDPVNARGKLKDPAKIQLASLAASLRSKPGKVFIEAHTDDRGQRLLRLTRTQRTAEEAKRELAAFGVAEDRITALGRSSDVPLQPNATSRGRKENRRVVVFVETPATAVATAPTLARVVANGRPMDLSGAGAVGDVPTSSSGEVAMFITTSSGARARLRLRSESIAVVEGAPLVVDAKMAALVNDILVRVEEEERARRAALPVAVDDGGTPNSIVSVDDGGVDVAETRLARDVGSDAGSDGDGNDAGAPLDGGKPGDTVAPLVASNDGDAGVDDDGGAMLAMVATDGGAVDGTNAGGGVPPLTVGGSSVVKRTVPVSERLPFDGDGVAPAWWPTTDRVPAANLSVNLPPEAEVLRSKKLFVHGATDATNRIAVNGHDVVVDDEGKFVTLIELPEGSSELVVEAVDVLGNRGRVSRLIHVDTSGWFALLLGDFAVGNDGALLDERSSTTSLTLGDAFIYGHGVAYVNGRFTGDVFFKDYELTLHADTRRWADDAFVRDVNEPDLLYPVYGDSSLEVQDAQAQYPLYLDFRADNSHVRVGNLRASLSGGDLLRYQRPRYGAEVEFDRGWSEGVGLDRSMSGPLVAPAADPWRTTVKAFATTGNENTRHARVELAGTGGAIYFLRHEDLVEGSERVAIIVRDAVTGAEIARSALARNLDYTIRYAEGRVVLKETIPTFADSAFLVNHNLGQVRAGHRVYVEVEYDHDSLEAFQGFGGGAEAKQVIFGHAEVGAGYVYESRADGTPAYQLGGVHTKLFLDPGTFVKAEWAYSQSVDAGNFVSYDGGLTYRGMGQSLDADPVRQGDTVYSTERQGWALKLDGQAELGELVGRKNQDAVVRAYFQRQSPGFYAGAAIVEQGQWKWGSEGRWRVTDDDLLRLRYDGVVAEIPEIPHVMDPRILHRQVAIAGYERQILKSLKGVVEYGYGYTFDSGVAGSDDPDDARSFHTNVIALGLDWQALDRLALAIKQEVILSGDGGWIFFEDGTGQLQQWNDHLITHGQARYALTDDLELQATESVRWNGENQTTLGVSWKVNEASRVYANERFAMQNGGMSTTTVVGGESDIGEGSRTYAEYQLQSGFSGQQTRGVVGLATKVKLPFGFALAFGYERTQVLAGNVSTTSTGAAAPGAFSDGTFFAAPGAANGGDYLYGSGSRDSLSGGVEYARGSVRASQRFELRYDNFDEERGGRDRIWALSMTNFAWTINPELSVLARYNIGLAQDLTLAQREAHLEEGTMGLAYRPITHDWVSAMIKLSRRVEARPLSLKEGTSEEYSAHAIAIEPIIELPWRLQLVEKLALKHASVALDDMPRANAYTTLWINRINWHALGTIRAFDIDPIIPGEIDIGLEYRMLWGLTAMTMEHGPLVEVQYAPLPYFRIGVGWNFTRFTDNELDRNDTDNSGFFIRAVGQY